MKKSELRELVREVIRKVGDEYAVYPKKGGKRLGTHKTRKGAEDQMTAIHISKYSENLDPSYKHDGKSAPHGSGYRPAKKVNELKCKYGQYFCPHDKVYKCRKSPKKTVSEIITPADPSKVDREELRMGIKVEMEHTNDPKEAARIALQHLAEDPKYYTKLASLNLEGVHDPMNPGILKKRLGKLSCSKVRKERQGLKDKGTTYAKALQRYLNYHCQ
jgi:hypothetical protein